MWELQLATPLGKIPLRKLLSFVAATLVTIFSYLLLNTTNVSAADAQWDQGSITYNGDTFRGPTEPTPDHDLPADTKVYTSPDPQSGEVKVIYFAPDANITTATTANYVTYNQGPTGGLSNKSTPTSITIDETTSTEADVAANQETSSCKLDGIGWIICPVTNTLAVGMDWIFDIISGFLKVRPLDVNADSTMYKAWSVMRNFANIAFIGAFLVIIYSQLSSFGLSNYGIKRTLPRLILAAILVNVSYWICAVAIDVFNIMGYSLQSIFIGLRNTILGSNSNSWDLVSWESITAFILSGGAIVGAGIAGVSALTTTMAGTFAVGGVGLLLAPILLGAFLTVMVVLFILAARQAIITILVVIAPLAFVAFLLPNTEKWFDKWRSLFMTMLIMFPAFSIIFGGAQLAGILIIQNADDINVVLLGMAVQIAPLAITPLLFKLSGSLLGRIAGVINNPSKGILDRTKNWSKDRLDARRADEMRKNREQAAQGNLTGARNFSRRKALKYDNQRRLREGLKANNEANASSLFMNSDEGRALHEAEFVSKQLKERVETDVNVELKTKLNKEGSRLHADNLDLELAKDQLKDQEAITTTQMANYRTRSYLKDHLNPIFSDETIETIAGLSHYEQRIATRGLAAQRANHVKSTEFADALNVNALNGDAGALRREAAGIDNVNGRGEIAILSQVKSQIENEKDTLVKNIKIASDIKPGDVDGLELEFRDATVRGDAEKMRAYADLLTEAANPGVTRLRKVLNETETTIQSVSPDAMDDLKAHINSSSAINGAAEDIATWSRSVGRSLSEITYDKKTWEGLNPNSFAGMKKSSQEAALYTDSISQETASAIKRGPAYQNLKPDMRERIERLASGRSNYKDEVVIDGELLSGRLNDPFS